MPRLLYEGNKGFVLLMNVLIIGTISILIGGLMMLLGLYSLKSSRTYINKTRSLAINNGCAEEALYQIRQNRNYIGLANLSIDNSTCYYGVESLGGDNRQVTVSSTVSAIVSKTKLLLTVNASSTINISSWQEYP